ncbi:hypothetical protein X275_09850 [Marinitoga sp. 1197]|uniref:hypothetical protein n=1 Tax=Marinitoga sp. 1197 TaxID=1428449 RepID=UPI0006415FA8|nr:hypothetical protein [Marinitoga sp. 1197]KLO21286.1 hypothetical protein X275_09850 [Marinitoga sp. 1197]
MSEELKHIADMMFEISGKNTKEILEDFFDSLNKIFKPLVGGLESEYNYYINQKDIDDIIFDIGNYSLNKIKENQFPSKVAVGKDQIKVYYSKIIELRNNVEIKGVVYPEVLNKEKLRVIFDV